MTRTQWIRYLRTLDRLREKGSVTHDQKLNIINRLIDKERAEWDQIELEHMGLKNKDN